MKLFSAIWRNRVLLQIYLPPLLFIFIPILYKSPAALCGYLLLIMISYWLTECIPTAVTGLLPLIFLPLFGIARAGDLAACYMRDIMLTFLGSIAVAVMLETAGLHKRIALKTLMIFGQKPAKLLFGIMLITWFCSMWTSNTAATVLMMTILDALMKQFEKQMKAKAVAKSRLELAESESAMNFGTKMMSSTTLSSQTTLVMRTSSFDENLTAENENKAFDGNFNGNSTDPNDGKARNGDIDVSNDSFESTEIAKTISYLKKMLGLSVCYSASCGGIATLTGTPTNLILLGQLQTSFNQTGQINFASWMICALPLSLLMIIAAWIWLQILYLGLGTFLRSLTSCFFQIARRNRHKTKEDEIEDGEDSKEALQRDYSALGPFSPKEYAAGIYFLLLVSLWLSRDTGSGGWGALFRPGYLTDTLPAFIIVLLAQCTPISLHQSSKFVNGKQVPSKKIEYLINWKDVEKNTPWGFLFLVGGGFAMSDGCKLSGLTALVGNEMRFLGDMPVPALILVIIVFTTVLTGVSSNLAVCSILLPLLADMSVKIKVNPMLIMFPATVASSFAFILPVSTPPNAVVFSKGYVTAGDMLRCGLVMSVFSVLITTMSMYTYIDWYLHLTELPAWAKDYIALRGNTTSPTNTSSSTSLMPFSLNYSIPV